MFAVIKDVLKHLWLFSNRCSPSVSTVKMELSKETIPRQLICFKCFIWSYSMLFKNIFHMEVYFYSALL